VDVTVRLCSSSSGPSCEVAVQEDAEWSGAGDLGSAGAGPGGPVDVTAAASRGSTGCRRGPSERLVPEARIVVLQDGCEQDERLEVERVIRGSYRARDPSAVHCCHATRSPALTSSLCIVPLHAERREHLAEDLAKPLGVVMGEHPERRRKRDRFTSRSLEIRPTRSRSLVERSINRAARLSNRKVKPSDSEA
jgi:hypothetical protein